MLTEMALCVQHTTDCCSSQLSATTWVDESDVHLDDGHGSPPLAVLGKTEVCQEALQMDGREHWEAFITEARLVRVPSTKLKPGVLRKLTRYGLVKPTVVSQPAISSNEYVRPPRSLKKFSAWSRTRAFAVEPRTLPGI